MRALETSDGPFVCARRRRATSRGMNGRYIAALALHGWYWMIPPAPRNTADPNAPLGVSTLLGTFDSAIECRQAAYAGEREMENHGAGSKLRAEMYQGWVCIASDDPRLAKERDLSARIATQHHRRPWPW